MGRHDARIGEDRNALAVAVESRAEKDLSQVTGRYTRNVIGSEVDHDRSRARARHPLGSRPRPFLRWAGGKRRLLPHISGLLPRKYGRLFEPFAGSAALFFLLQARSAVIGDTCAPLIASFEAVRDGVEQVLDRLDEWRVDRETFDQVKAASGGDRFDAAARFIYLNKTCWNGLYRVNGSGQFNVPYGRPKSATVVDPDNLRACSLLLQGEVDLAVADFAASVRTAGRGDLVYFDPPYVTGHNNNGFIDYNEVLFKWADQKRLAEVAKELDGRGAHVLISNADNEAVLDLFRSFQRTRVSRQSTIAGHPSARKATSEMIFFNTSD